MKLNSIKANSNLVVTGLQLFIVVVFSFTVTIIKCKFDFSQFDFLAFATTFLISNFTKIAFSNYAFKNAIDEPEFIQKKECIVKDKNIIYQNNLTEQFKDELKVFNKREKANHVIEKYREVTFKDLEKEKNRKHDVENSFSVLADNSKDLVLKFKYKYKDVTFAKVMTYGNAKTTKTKYNFSFSRAMLDRAVPTLIVSSMISVLMAVVTLSTKTTAKEMIIDLLFYIVTICMGVFTGLSLGKKIADEEYHANLENIASLIREITNKINPKQENEPEI